MCVPTFTSRLVFFCLFHVKQKWRFVSFMRPFSLSPSLHSEMLTNWSHSSARTCWCVWPLQKLPRYRLAVLWLFWQAVWTCEWFAHCLPFVISLGDWFAGQLNDRPVIQDDRLIECICTGDWLDGIGLWVWVIDYLTEWVVKELHSAVPLWPNCFGLKIDVYQMLNCSNRQIIYSSLL